ncbi:Transposase, Mutator family [Lentzea flava]|nr:Transposase, Mutator family [Lentzea flava]
MTDMMSGVENSEDSKPATGPDGLDEQLVAQLLESALEGEITDHLGDDKHDPAGRGTGNSRNGIRSKTVLTDAGPVEIDVPRDRDASFEPKIVAKRQRRLGGVDKMVISLPPRDSRPERSPRTWPRPMAPKCRSRPSPRSPTR